MAATALGYLLAVVMLVTNLFGDVVNVITGTEPRAVIGIPIAGVIIAYLLHGVASKVTNCAWIQSVPSAVADG